MRFRPANPNPSLPALHTLYLATTGGGKSQCLRWNPAIPKRGARVIGWDHAGDHDGLHFYSKKSFLAALRVALQRGGGFRIFYAGEKNPEAFEWWCEVVWSILDGNQLTYAIVEELAAVSPSVHRATPNAAVLLNEGRKFGLIFHGTSQKPQDVAKTYFDQCSIKFVGRQKGLAMRRRMAAEIGLEPEQIGQLQDLQFYHDDGRAEVPTLVTVPFRKPEGAIFHD